MTADDRRTRPFDTATGSVARRVAITQRVVEATAYIERRDALAHDWASWFSHTFPGDVLLPVPNHPVGGRAWAERVRPDAIILSNGNDLGEYAERDDTESVLIQYGLERQVPILGVCRGLQILNVHFGGKVVEDLRADGRTDHIANPHRMTVNDAWRVYLGEAAELEVNSFHGQGVTRENLAPPLEAVAWADDGVIEALVHPDHAVLAIQWHPERAGAPAPRDRDLIRRFVEEGAFWR